MRGTHDTEVPEWVNQQGEFSDSLDDDSDENSRSYLVGDGGPVMRGDEPKKMSPVGRRIWLLMQEHDPPYNRRTLAKKLTKEGIYPTTGQSVSNYLYRDHPPPDFVNAVARVFDLTPEQSELHWLHFRGVSDAYYTTGEDNG